MTEGCEVKMAKSMVPSTYVLLKAVTAFTSDDLKLKAVTVKSTV